MGGRLGFAVGKGLSTKGIIPPAITGYFNQDNLRALREAGYETGTGDNT
jgi:hypothetical protein